MHVPNSSVDCTSHEKRKSLPGRALPADVVSSRAAVIVDGRADKPHRNNAATTATTCGVKPGAQSVQMTNSGNRGVGPAAGAAARRSAAACTRRTEVRPARRERTTPCAPCLRATPRSTGCPGVDYPSRQAAQSERARRGRVCVALWRQNHLSIMAMRLQAFPRRVGRRRIPAAKSQFGRCLAL